MQEKKLIEVENIVSQTVSMENEPETPVSVRINKKLKADLKDIAKRTRRSVNSVAIIMLEQGVRAYRAGGVLIDSYSQDLPEDVEMETLEHPTIKRKSNAK